MRIKSSGFKEHLLKQGSEFCHLPGIDSVSHAGPYSDLWCQGPSGMKGSGESSAREEVESHNLINLAPGSCPGQLPSGYALPCQPATVPSFWSPQTFSILPAVSSSPRQAPWLLTEECETLVSLPKAPPLPRGKMGPGTFPKADGLQSLMKPSSSSVEKLRPSQESYKEKHGWIWLCKFLKSLHGLTL